MNKNIIIQLSICIIFLSGFLYPGRAPAQELIFSETLSEAALPPFHIVKKDMSVHYSFTRYAFQDDFFGPRDLRIMITRDLILTCHYVKTLIYPTGSSTYIGRISGNREEGYVTFSKSGDRISGLIQLSDGRKYQIDQTGPKIFALSLIMEEAFINKETAPDFLEPNIKQTGPGMENAASICDSVSVCSGPATIDLMVVYTPSAESNWGGTSNTVANITQAVSNLNLSMTNSGVNNVSFRLVYTGKVNYVESGSFSTDLSRLASTTDGYIDSVHILRDLYGADLVSLVIGSPTSSCGIGYLNTSNSAYSSTAAFNVSLYSCVVSNYTMAHEWGHNMGLRHDYYVDVGTTPCTHHHGYVNQNAINLGSSSTSAQRWRTIMAYNDQCAATGFNCTRINRWSNPNLTNNGDKTGEFIGNVNPADAAYAFHRMACLVANFRNEVSSCPLPAGLSESNISTTSVTLSWNAMSGAVNYDVDYRLAGTSAWNAAAVATTGTSLTLSGLGQGLMYDWQVRTKCSGSVSGYSQSQFITLAGCAIPANPVANNITASAATLNWAAVTGALSYDVDFRNSATSVWTAAASGHTGLSLSLSGLSSSTMYYWRVRANCAIESGNYTTASFTTASPACVTAFEPNESRTTAAVISLNTTISAGIAGSTDNDYFKVVTSATFTLGIALSNLPANYQLYLYNSKGTLLASSLNTETTDESIVYNNAAAATYYVRVAGQSGAFNNTNCYELVVNTILPPPCASAYDNSTNNTISGAAVIPFNTDIAGLINPAGDLDYYRIDPGAASSLTITLTNLPANYNLALYNSTGSTLLKSSAKTGTSNETISYAAAAGTYYVLVSGVNNANNAASCYTLRVGSTTGRDPRQTHDQQIAGADGGKAVAAMQLFPVPVIDRLYIIFSSPNAEMARLEIMEVSGRRVSSRIVSWKKGVNQISLDMKSLKPGVYFIRSQGHETVITEKIVVQK